MPRYPGYPYPVKAYQLKVQMIDRLQLAQNVRQRAIEDGQSMGTALLYAEAKLGELLKGIHPQSSQQGRLRTLPEGITHKQSHYAQTLADHKEEIEEVIQEAKKNEDIPTKKQVFRKIKEQVPPWELVPYPKV